MDAILEFKVRAIKQDIGLTPSEREVENEIKKTICEYLGADIVEITELAVRYKRLNEPWKREDDGKQT